MKVLVVGSTGVLGRNVVPRLIEQGHEVRALVRRQDQRETFERLGIETATGDILNPGSLMEAARGCNAALHLATAIPTGGSFDWTMNDRIRREGTENLIHACKENHIEKYIQQSIVFLYGDQRDNRVDESLESDVWPFVQSAADMEAMVNASGLDWCILRGGFFYGPGTGQSDQWLESAANGSLTIPEDGQPYLSLIHVSDMARAVVMSMSQAPSQSIFNVVDDKPVRYKELYPYFAALVNGPEPKTGGELFLPSLNCSNEAIKAALGWEPAYPTFKSGFAQ